jgi:hypothetical protein
MKRKNTHLMKLTSFLMPIGAMLFSNNVIAQCSAIEDQNFDTAPSTTYPSSVTQDCITYTTSGSGYANISAGGEASDSPLFSGKSLLFYYDVQSPSYAKFSSVNSSTNFKLVSLVAEFFGHGNGNTSERYSIVGFDNGSEVVRVDDFNVTQSATYGTGSTAISYVRSSFNNSFNNSGTLTFGNAWGYIDEVRFVLTDAAPNNNLWIGLDNIDFDAPVQTVTSVSEAAETVNSISPNPSYGVFSIQSNAVLGEVNVRNNLGEIVHTERFTKENASLDISHLQAGIYYVSVGTEVFKVLKVD